MYVILEFQILEEVCQRQGFIPPEDYKLVWVSGLDSDFFLFVLRGNFDVLVKTINYNVCVHNLFATINATKTKNIYLIRCSFNVSFLLAKFYLLSTCLGT